MNSETNLNKRCLALYSAEKYSDALKEYEEYLETNPFVSVRTLLNLALVLNSLGHSSRELDLYRRLEAAGVEDHDFLVNYSIAEAENGANVKAIELAEKALMVAPNSVVAHDALGNALANSERRREARKAFQLGASRKTSTYQKVINRVLALVEVDPVPPDDSYLYEYREKFSNTMDLCVTEIPKIPPSDMGDMIWALSKVSRTYIGYLGLNDVGINQRHSEALRLALKPLLPNYTDRHGTGDRLRIGVITTARYHQRLFCDAQLEGLNKSAYSVVHIILNNDSYSPPAESEYYRLPFDIARLPEVVRRIRLLALDVIFFPEVGMSIECQFLSNVKLGRTAFTSWLHPVTTGSKHIETFVSSGLMEPPEYTTHYSERVFLCDDLAIKIPDGTLDCQVEWRHEETSRDVGINIVCLQNPIKILPATDLLFVKILKEFGSVHLHFVDGPIKALSERFEARFSRACGDLDNAGNSLGKRVSFHRRMNRETLLKFLGAMHLAIDAPSWSGGNTTLDCLAVNLPVVTFSGPSLRSRHTAAMYAQMGSEPLRARLISQREDELLGNLQYILEGQNLLALRQELSKKKLELYGARSGVSRFVSQISLAE